jgi:hypothetical protein
LLKTDDLALFETQNEPIFQPPKGSKTLKFCWKKAETGNWKMESGSWKLETGKSKLESGPRQLVAGS